MTGNSLMPTSRGLVKLLSGVESFDIETRECQVTCGTKEAPEVSVFADGTSSWHVNQSPVSFKMAQANSAGSAMVVVPRGAKCLDDFSVSLKGKSSFDGSMAAANVTLSVDDSAKAQIDSIEADSVLISAFGSSRVVISELKSRRLLVMVFDNASVEIMLTGCDLILVRQSENGQVRFFQAIRATSEVDAPVFALSGKKTSIFLPPAAFLAPQDIVDQYWSQLVSE